MARPAHPRAMAASRPGPTRTAPPEGPAGFPFSGRYRAYTLFGATGILYLLAAFVALRVVWALGTGEESWSAIQSQLAHPLYVLFHALSLVAVCFVAVRFFRLFPKAQPPRIGRLRPPPRPVTLAVLYGVWIGATAVLSAVLAGACSG